MTGKKELLGRLRCCKQIEIMGATIAHCICLRIPTCCPGFESQAHHLCFLQFILELCHVEKTKINKEEDRINPFKKQNIFDLSDIFLSLSLSLAHSLSLSLSEHLLAFITFLKVLSSSHTFALINHAFTIDLSELHTYLVVLTYSVRAFFVG